MYVRVKREKTTLFVQVAPTELVLEVKEKVESVLGHRARDMQLLTPTSDSVLDESKSLEAQRVADDAVLPLCLWDEENQVFDDAAIVYPSNPQAESDKHSSNQSTQAQHSLSE